MNVVFFGDSITAGEGVSPHLHFVSLLARDIDEEYGDFDVINAGYNGDTTRLALLRMPQDVQKFNPVLVVAQFGLNDCNKWETDKGLPRVSPESYRDNMYEIVQRSGRFGSRKVLVLTSHPTRKDWMYEASRQNYNDLLRLEASNFVLVDIDKAWPGGGPNGLGDLLIDDIHLSAAGHEFYRQMLQPYVFNALRDVAE